MDVLGKTADRCFFHLKCLNDLADARVYIYAAAKYFLTAARKEKEEAQEAGRVETNNECATLNGKV